MTAVDGGDVDVVVAVIVVIADGASHSVHFDIEAGLAGDIREGSVVIVVIEGGVGIAGFVAGPVHGVDEENVLPAVVVIVDEAGSAAHGFRKIFSPKSSA